MRVSFNKSKSLLAAAFALMLFVSASPRLAIAQAAPTAKPAPAQSTGNSRDNFITPKTAQDQNLAAADQEDEEAVYKKSPTVRAVGRVFHLSPEHASVAFEDFNFLILAVALVYLGAKYLPKMFRERQQKIDQQLVEARVATEEANERLLAVESRLGRLDKEIEELRARAEQESAGDEQRIKASIEEERRKIVAAAEHEIHAISLSAERNLRKFAAELAVARASAHLHVTEQEDRAMVRDFKPGDGAAVGKDLDRRRN